MSLSINDEIFSPFLCVSFYVPCGSTKSFIHLFSLSFGRIFFPFAVEAFILCVKIFFLIISNELTFNFTTCVQLKADFAPLQCCIFINVLFGSDSVIDDVIGSSFHVLLPQFVFIAVSHHACARQ